MAKQSRLIQLEVADPRTISLERIMPTPARQRIKSSRFLNQPTYSSRGRGFPGRTGK